MTLALLDAQPKLTGLLDGGLDAVDAALQAAFAAAEPDNALIMALNSLRSRYVFDRMRVTRAQIVADDAAPETAQILTDLSSACGKLEEIQTGNAATTDWVNKASSAVDTAFGIFSKLAKL